MEMVLPDTVFPSVEDAKLTTKGLKDNAVVGSTIRLRQVRTKNANGCVVSKLGEAHKWILFCFSPWSTAYNDELSFMPNWING